MNYRVEILTATKDGLAAFLRDLKRAQLRHQTSFEVFMDAVKSDATVLKRLGGRQQFLASSAIQHEQYAKYIEVSLTEWESKQRRLVEEQRESVPEAEAKGRYWTCPDFVDTWVKLPMLRDPTVARRPGG